MKRKIDSKYEIQAIGCDSHSSEIGGGDLEIKIVNVYNGNEIPEDEPTFIFRAKDRLAIEVLRFYKVKCELDGCTSEQLEGITNELHKFISFRNNNPDKMKQPGITMPQDMKKEFPFSEKQLK